MQGKEVTLRFAETSVEGSAGCNTYGGSYTVSEDRLRLSGVYATEMACMEPAGIMKQEQAYLNALNTAAQFQVDGDRLEVYDGTGTQILAFVAAGE
jgi:heat shock protein HslJ